MQFKWHIGPEMSPEKVDSLLKMEYKFPLSRFANVIADVFMNFSFFSKGFDGRKRIDVRREKDDLIKIKDDLLKKVDKHFRTYHLIRYPSDRASATETRITSDPEKFYGDAFYLKYFFWLVDLEKDLFNEWLELVGHNKNSPTGEADFPFLGKRLRNVSDTAQIFILFSLAMKTNLLQKSGYDENIHWEKINELLVWFKEKLQPCTYATRLKPLKENEKSRWKSMRNFCRKELLRYGPALERSMMPRYFYKSSNERTGLDLVRIVFYRDSIKIVFRDKDNYRVLQTLLDRSKHLVLLPQLTQESEVEEGFVLEIKDSYAA